MPGYTVIEGKGISKSDKELVQSILGGEMKNAWQRGDGKDIRDNKGGGWNSKSPSFLSNYEQIFEKGGL